jgi:hypothetical protein
MLYLLKPAYRVSAELLHNPRDRGRPGERRRVTTRPIIASAAAAVQDIGGRHLAAIACRHAAMQLTNHRPRGWGRPGEAKP